MPGPLLINIVDNKVLFRFGLMMRCSEIKDLYVRYTITLGLLRLLNYFIFSLVGFLSSFFIAQSDQK